LAVAPRSASWPPLGLGAPVRLAAQKPTEDEATRLAKATQNPVADLVSVPFQFNFNTGGGYGDRTFFNLNLQPVVPVKGVLPKWTITPARSSRT
jgi:hypothetical protein